MDLFPYWCPHCKKARAFRYLFKHFSKLGRCRKCGTKLIFKAEAKSLNK